MSRAENFEAMDAHLTALLAEIRAEMSRSRESLDSSVHLSFYAAKKIESALSQYRTMMGVKSRQRVAGSGPQEVR